MKSYIKEIKFSKAIKLIHPDLNPNIQNVEEKILLLKKYKNNFKKLYELLVEWDIIKDEKIDKNKILFEYIFNSIHPDFNKWIPLVQSLKMIKKLRNFKNNFNEMMNLAKIWGINVKKFE